jgi:hypothetical protein
MRLMILPLVLALAACGQEESTEDSNRMSVRPAGFAVASMPEGQRNAVFIRAIRDAGQDCQQVESSKPGGAYQGMPVWQATCRGGRHWTIVIADDGTAQLLDADQARLVTN